MEGAVRVAHKEKDSRHRRHVGARSLRRQERATAKFPLDMIPELNETIERQLEVTRKLESRRAGLSLGFSTTTATESSITYPRGAKLQPSGAGARRTHTARLPTHRSAQSDQCRRRSAHHDGAGRMGGYRDVETLQHHRREDPQARRGQAERIPRRAEGPAESNVVALVRL